MTLLDELRALLGLSSGVVLSDDEMAYAVSLASEEKRSGLEKALAAYKAERQRVIDKHIEQHGGPYGGMTH
jgi:hypothetical protein